MMGTAQTEPKTMEPNTVKKTLCAALIVMSSSAAAMAEIGPANSTNQHARDSASFYDSSPFDWVDAGRRHRSDRRSAAFV